MLGDLFKQLDVDRQLSTHEEEDANADLLRRITIAADKCNARSDMETVPARSEEPMDASIEAVQALQRSLKTAWRREAALDEQHNALEAEISRLQIESETVWLEIRCTNRLRDSLAAQIEKWERARPFRHFLRLPTELRDLVLQEYFNANGRHNSIRHGYTESITLACKQLRTEAIDWLLSNRPLSLTFQPYFRNYDSEGKLHSQLRTENDEHNSQELNRNVPKGLLARVRYVEVTSRIDLWRTKYQPRWTLNLVSGILKAEPWADRCVRGHCPQEYAKVVENRLRLVLDKIMPSRLRKFHLDGLLEAVVLNPRMAAARLARIQLRHLPFAKGDAF